MTGVLTVFVTTGSREEAEKIARAVVEENLAACANILPGVRSIYRWQGAIEQTQECALILKTTDDKFPALEELVKKMHSYKSPCIVAWAVVAGNEAYLQWVKDVVRLAPVGLKPYSETN